MNGFSEDDFKPRRAIFYRKNEIDEQIALGRTVLIVASKEDADYLWSIGIPATCIIPTTNIAINKWRDFNNANWTDFTDADIVVHQRAQAACHHLLGIAKRLRILYLEEYPTFSGYTREELDELIERTRDYALQATSLGEWDAGDEPGAIPPRQWLLGNQFCRSFISSIVAAGGAGKSALRLLQFISLAIGRSLCGQHVFRRCRVLLISLEDDRDELQRRIKAVLDYYDRVLCERGEPGISRSNLKGWLFCASPKLAKLAEMKDRARSIGPLEKYIREAVKRRQPDLVSLDPFVKTHSLEENDSGDMDFVCDLLARMAVEFEIAVDSPHHVHKGQVAPGDADSGRGSSGIRDAGASSTRSPQCRRTKRKSSTSRLKSASHTSGSTTPKLIWPRARARPNGSTSSARTSATPPRNTPRATPSKWSSRGSRRMHGATPRTTPSTPSSTISSKDLSMRTASRPASATATPRGRPTGRCGR
jgi:RecA-family ATPase